MKPYKFSLFLFAIIFAFSCNKNSSSPGGGTAAIKATIDGSSQTFNVGATASLVSFGSEQALSITGVQSNSNTAYLITLALMPSNGSSITPGTYTGNASSDEVELTYAQASTGIAYQNDPTISSSNATVVITSISSTNVKGTFSGTLVLETGSGAATKTITNGSFDLAIK